MSSSEELRGQMDSSSSSAPCVMDSNEPPASCVQVLDSSGPLEPAATTSTGEAETCSSDSDRRNAPLFSSIMPESCLELTDSDIHESEVYTMNLTSEIRVKWNINKIFKTFPTVKACVKFAEELGMIPREKMCSYHGTPMVIVSGGAFGMFRCRRSNCPEDVLNRTEGTWFENVVLYIPLPAVFEIMYSFSNGFTHKQTQKETADNDREIVPIVPIETIIDWFDKCRETIMIYDLENKEEKEKIGGPGKKLKIIESKFGKRKYDQGRLEGKWMLTIIEDGSQDLRIEICPSKSDALVVIQRHVREGSIIHTGVWEAYNCLPEHNYVHEIHSDESLVPPDGTYKLGSGWQGLTRAFHDNKYEGSFEDRLIEYLWRRRVRLNKLDPFEELLKCILYVYNINK
ncbi:uncharacterized protein LOC133528942 [Cydia pomonella]|uniref:uncharacterized protein LOC133528942 n=1 Tax=Cydia pomonella TaxID=82600 RepID=UPI002ADE93A9|nr:uncharacterized protein LOC133528942 [Cydia pomonella]